MSDPTESRSIELDSQTADTLVATAAANGLSLREYLRGVAESLTGAVRELGPAEFDRWLDELAAGPGVAPSLPLDFSRADVYGDHD